MALDMKEIGKKLIEVGTSETKTGKELIKAAAQLENIGEKIKKDERIDKSLTSIENGIRSTRDLLKPVSAVMHAISDALGSISTPKIEVDTREIDLPVIGRIHIVTGVSISSTRLFKKIADDIDSAADDLDNIIKAIKDIADGMKAVHAELPNITASMLSGAADMEDGGNNLVSAGTAMTEAGALLAA